MNSEKTFKKTQKNSTFLFCCPTAVSAWSAEMKFLDLQSLIPLNNVLSALMSGNQFVVGRMDAYSRLFSFLFPKVFHLFSQLKIRIFSQEKRR